MFKLNENYEVDRKILKCDDIRYSLEETSTKKSQINVNKSRKDTVISSLNIYLQTNFEVIKKTDNSRYGNGIDIRLVTLRPIALCSNFKFTASSRKHLD